MSPEEIKQQLLDEFNSQRVVFIPRFMCDHDTYSNSYHKDGDCSSCGTPAWKCKEDIKEKQHRNELRRIKELKEAKGE
jgi:hypothetical protein